MATIKKESFGKLSDGREVELYTLCNTCLLYTSDAADE